MNFYFLNKNSKDQRQYREFYRYFEEKKINYNIIKRISDINFSIENLQIICSDPKTIILLKLFRIMRFKKFNIIYRTRGLSPEESYFKNNNYLKYLILCIIELITILSADIILFVSEKHREYIRNKYIIQRKGTIVHNYNLGFQYNRNKSRLKKSYNVCYAGSLSKWQNTDIVLDLFARLFENNNNLNFYFYTDDIRGIDKHIFKRYGFIKFNNLSESQLMKELEDMDYGVIIRENLSLNTVSSPFKIMDYLTAGLRIISSDNIGDYKKLFEKNNIFYFDSYNNFISGTNIDKLNEFIVTDISDEDIEDVNKKINIRKEFDEFIKLID